MLSLTLAVIPLLVLLLIMCRWLNASSLFFQHQCLLFTFGLRQGGSGGWVMVRSESETLALLQALCHLHGRVCCCSRRLSTEEGCGSLRLVPLDFFAWGIETTNMMKNVTHLQVSQSSLKVQYREKKNHGMYL